MSTTSTAAFQVCCVCGKDTSTRCSACAKVGIDLFFCSPEHQKLVWKGAHSEVCGSKAHPFLYPDMTAFEAHQVVQLAKRGLEGLSDDADADERSLAAQLARHGRSRPPRREGPTVVAGLCAIARVPEQQFERVMPIFLQDSKPLETKRRISLAMNARSLVFTLQSEDGNPDPRLGPFYPVATVESHISARYAEVHGTLQASQLLHRALILFQLVHLKRQASPPPSFRPEFALHAFRSFAVTCFDVLPFIAEVEIETTLGVFARYTMPTLAFDMEYEYDSATFKLRDLQVSPAEDEEAEVRR
ncbi:hypothetical protein JCM8097_007965 [Rhodosporidiobolus ruineniae]